MPRIPVYQITVPEYQVRSKPDWEAIGDKIDRKLKRYFLGRSIALRCLSSKDHRGKTLNELVRIIKRIGTDRYSPRRQGDRYANNEKKLIDFFALDFRVGLRTKMMALFIEPFFTWPPKFGRSPIRLDLVLIYDRKQVKQVLHTYPDRSERKRDGFIFREPQHRRRALLGVMKIL